MDGPRELSFEAADGFAACRAVEATTAWHSQRQKQYTADSFFFDCDHSGTKMVQ